MELGRRLAATPNNKRGFSAGELLREIADRERTEDPLLLDSQLTDEERMVRESVSTYARERLAPRAVSGDLPG